ncbi:hypothetical protein KAH94_00445 [bacterium]|nr:hypothetical protein [bacterium]
MKKLLIILSLIAFLPLISKYGDYNFSKKTTNDKELSLKNAYEKIIILKKKQSKVTSLLKIYLKKYQEFIKSKAKYTPGDSITTILKNLQQLIALKKRINKRIAQHLRLYPELLTKPKN